MAFVLSPSLVEWIPPVLGRLVDSSIVLLYVGPDQLMPIASVFSAILGVALMFWHRLVALVRRCWGVVNSRSRTASPEPGSRPAE